jgi:hypothetical protein
MEEGWENEFPRTAIFFLLNLGRAQGTLAPGPEPKDR